MIAVGGSFAVTALSTKGSCVRRKILQRTTVNLEVGTGILAVTVVRLISHPRSKTVSLEAGIGTLVIILVILRRKHAPKRVRRHIPILTFTIVTHAITPVVVRQECHQRATTVVGNLIRRS